MPKQNRYPVRFILTHLHPVSARLRFLKADNRHVILPVALPRLSELIDLPADKTLETHPAQFISTVAEFLGVNSSLIQFQHGFRVTVDTPSQLLPIFLLRLTREEPASAPKNCDWIELPDSFSVLPLERQIMLAVYRYYLESSAD